ncbi:MAG: glycosyltransferase family 2 protein, partial [Gammaproteobacteria bacterium]
SLVDVATAHHAGGFREDYFIDQVDHEFCLRMRAHGYRVVITRRTVMEHSVGEPSGPYIPLLGVMPSHSPLRKYYITRNTLITVADYWRTEPEWCMRRAMRLLLGLALMALMEKQRSAKLKAFAAGIIDGLNHRTGPCRHNWL